MKKTILIDLDGVLNTYTGNYEKDTIPPMKDGAYKFLKDLSEHYTIKIFTTRNLLLTAEWVMKNNLNEYIDDVKTKDLSIPTFAKLSITSSILIKVG